MPRTAADFPLPYGPDTPGMPSGLQKMAQSYQQRYVDLANKVPFGVGLFGRGDEYQNAVSAAWAKRLQGLVEMQKGMDAVASPRNERDDINSGIETEINAGRINPNTPLLNKDAVYSTDYLKHRQTGSMNPASLGLLDSIINNQQAQSYGLPSQAGITQPPSPTLPPLNTGDAPLNAGVTKVYKPLTTSYDPTQLPTFMSDATFGNIQDAQTQAATNGLTQGQERYNFDAEAPKREADLKKSLQEVQNLILTGRKTEAETKLKQLEVQWYGKKTQSEINRNNRPPGGGHAPQPTTASELARMYQAGAFGKPGTQEAVMAYRQALQNDPAGYTTVTDSTDGEGKTTHSVSRRIPASGGSPAPASSGKAGSVTLSTGRKVKI